MSLIEYAGGDGASGYSVGRVFSGPWFCASAVRVETLCFLSSRSGHFLLCASVLIFRSRWTQWSCAASRSLQNNLRRTLCPTIVKVQSPSTKNRPLLLGSLGRDLKTRTPLTCLTGFDSVTHTSVGGAWMVQVDSVRQLAS